MNAEVEILSRPACHLCDTVLKSAKELQAQYRFTLRVTNVEDHPALEEAFGNRIPVVRVGAGVDPTDVTILEYPIAQADLAAELDRLWST